MVFWSLFGQVRLEEFETHKYYHILQQIAWTLFGVFNILAVLVAMNMLIAMLNESFSKNAVR